MLTVAFGLVLRPSPTIPRTDVAMCAVGICRQRSTAKLRGRSTAAYRRNVGMLLAGARFALCGRFRTYRARDDRQSTPLPIEPDGADL
jgi:hypothetical protein